MANRLEILENSLKKKQDAFDKALEAHMEDAKSANGQPLNDKRGGQATMNRWELQNNRLRKLQEGIEATKRAIENEKSKISYVVRTNNTLPQVLLDKVASGELEQWRKHPSFFFVKGIDKARLQYKDGKLLASYYNHLDAKDRMVFITKAKEILRLIEASSTQLVTGV